MPILGTPEDTRSVAEVIATLAPDERAEILQKLTPDQTEELRHDWTFWGRPTQQEPQEHYFCWLCLAGRGWGKTKTGAMWVRRRVERARDRKSPIRIALVAETAADARDVMVEGDSGILASSHPDFTPIYQPSRRRVIWPDGSIAQTFSGDEPGQLRGPQFHYAWVDELAKYTYPDDTWDNLEFGLRLGDEPQVIVTTTPRPIPIVVTLYDDPLTVVTAGSSYENIGNLAPTYIKRVIQKYEGTRLGQQEIHAQILRDVPGALWTMEMIQGTRVNPGEVPKMTRFSVGVDPAMSSEDSANETGIVVVGLGENGHGYVFRDASGVYSPYKWAQRACKEYHHWGATRVVGESNNGGDLVGINVHSYDPTVKFRKVFAEQSKGKRAEPIALLWEQGKMHMVGNYPEMESQMTLTTVDEYLGPGSPDRMDAMVWAARDIMLGTSTSYAAKDYVILQK